MGKQISIFFSPFEKMRTHANRKEQMKKKKQLIVARERERDRETDWRDVVLEMENN